MITVKNAMQFFARNLYLMSYDPVILTIPFALKHSATETLATLYLQVCPMPYSNKKLYIEVIAIGNKEALYIS
jgi:hypothetical protein